MIFLKWYLIIGVIKVIVSIIAEIYDAKKGDGRYYLAHVVDTWKVTNLLAARSKLIIRAICEYILLCILWLPLAIFNIVDGFIERLHK